MLKKLIAGVGLALLIAGCGARPATRTSGTANDTQSAQVSPAKGVVEAVEAPAEESNTGVVVEVGSGGPKASSLKLPKPENQLAEQEYTWRQLLRRDSIEPIYEPTFLPAGKAPYDDQELVIGIEINGEAKAYAIGPLNGREMVNDTLGGIPILVTW